MDASTRHSEEAALDFFKELLKTLGYWFRDEWDLAKGRAMAGAVTFIIGILAPYIGDVRWPTVLCFLLTLVLWWNAIGRLSLVAGMVGTIEGLLPALQSGKEIEGPVTNDGRIAAARIYDFLSDIAVMFLLLLLVPVVVLFWLPVPNYPRTYAVIMISLLLWAISHIEVPKERIETVGGKDTKSKKIKKDAEEKKK